MTRTQRRPASRDLWINAARARCASAWVMPCRSRRASIGWRPRFSRSALARSIPEKRSRGGCRSAARTWLCSPQPGGGGTPVQVKPPRRGRRSGVTLRIASRHSNRSLWAALRYSSSTLPASCRSSTIMTCSRRGPWAPSSMRCSMSPVRDGPVMKLIARGSPSADPQPIPTILVGGDDLIPAHHHDMGVGQKIQRRRGFGPGNQHQRPGLGDRGKAGGQADRIFRLRPAAADVQQRSSIPGDVVQARVGCQRPARREGFRRRDSRATASGTAASELTRATVACTSSAMATKRSIRPRSVECRRPLRGPGCADAPQPAPAAPLRAPGSSRPRLSERRMRGEDLLARLAHLSGTALFDARPTGCGSCGPPAPACRAPRSSRRPTARRETARGRGRATRARGWRARRAHDRGPAGAPPRPTADRPAR